MGLRWREGVKLLGLKSRNFSTFFLWWAASMNEWTTPFAVPIFFLLIFMEKGGTFRGENVWIRERGFPPPICIQWRDHLLAFCGNVLIPFKQFFWGKKNNRSKGWKIWNNFGGKFLFKFCDWGLWLDDAKNNICVAFFRRILIIFILIDSSFNVLQLWFWVQSHAGKHLGLI